MLNKRDIPNLLLAGMRTEFMGAYETATKDHEKLAMVVKSTKSVEPWSWLGSTPKMGEWKDTRIPQGMLEHNFSITNRSFEASISVDRDAIEDDQYGQIVLRVKELATEAVRYRDELAFSLISQGNATIGTSGDYTGKTISCYDGRANFASDHSEGDSGTQSNLGSTALGVTSVQAAITAMSKFKNDKGKPAGTRPNLLVVPPDLEWKATELFTSDYFPEEGTTTAKLAKNTLKGKLNTLVTPYLTDPDNWYLFDTTGVIKPLILQVRREPEFTSLIDNTEAAFMRKELYYGIDWRGEIAWSDWRKSYGAFCD